MTLTRHGWRLLNVINWAAEHGYTVYPAATLRPYTDEVRCVCSTRICTRPSTQGDGMCDECREHEDCHADG